MTPPEVVPAQVDREAAADYGRYRLFSGLSADGIECGRADGNDLVQAFARHRLATIEDCAKVCDGNRTDDDSMWDRASAECASLIRQLSAPPPPPVDVGEGG